MNIRGLMMASGWKKAITFRSVETSRVWRRACATAAAPRDATSGVETPTGAGSAQAKTKKRKMCLILRNLNLTGESLVSENLNRFMREEGVSVTQADLVRWAKYLEKDGKDHHALEIFEWMERNHMSFSPRQHAIFLNLVAKTKGVAAAGDYFERIDPNFNNMDFREKNWPSYQKLVDWMYPESFLQGIRYPTEDGTYM